uniref:MYND-type domain-containing protein n=1 Tax=Branchiostoma floridae TaxID=7739 RepID=C3ZT00_BRAFL|eukprot:XP_002588334.1 hypothetical protein BRAFLDRAFT_81473 [Branchiostoma floridae]
MTKQLPLTRLQFKLALCQNTHVERCPTAAVNGMAETDANKLLLSAAAKGWIGGVKRALEAAWCNSRHTGRLPGDSTDECMSLQPCGTHVDTVRRLIELGARPDLTDGHVGQKLAVTAEIRHDFAEESLKLIEEARKTKLLRCCNPKCGKPGYRSTGTLKLCGRCKLTRYCSRDCQKQHWSVGHKKCCGNDAYSIEGSDHFQLGQKLCMYLGEQHPELLDYQFCINLAYSKNS